MKKCIIIFCFFLFGCISLMPKDNLVFENDDFKDSKIAKLDIYNMSNEKILNAKCLFLTNFYKEINTSGVEKKYINFKVGVPIIYNDFSKQAYIRINKQKYEVSVEKITDQSFLEVHVNQNNINVRNYNVFSGKILFPQAFEKNIIDGSEFALRVYCNDNAITTQFDGTKYRKLKKFANYK